MVQHDDNTMHHNDTMTKQLRPPAFDTGSVNNEYIDNLIRMNQETDKRMEALYCTHLDYHSFDSVHIALWSPGTRPSIPIFEYIDTLCRHK